MSAVITFTILSVAGLYAYDELSKKISRLGCTILILVGLLIFALLDNS